MPDAAGPAAYVVQWDTATAQHPHPLLLPASQSGPGPRLPRGLLEVGSSSGSSRARPERTQQQQQADSEAIADALDDPHSLAAQRKAAASFLRELGIEDDQADLGVMGSTGDGTPVVDEGGGEGPAVGPTPRVVGLCLCARPGVI